MLPRVLRTAAEVRALVRDLRRTGRRVAFVPTMGFLHEGHLSLMREGRVRADRVLASIFVNPTQFGPREDLSRYPRDLEGDLAKCGSAGVEAVFCPEPWEVYPEGFQTFVEVTQVSQGLCGEKRPGHFRGVATVVTKLFNIVQPDVALFGEKDFQQLRVIQALVRDLDLPVEVVGRPTVRERDGLAMSSRNAYLSPEERQRALALWRGIQAAQRLLAQGVDEAARLVAAVRSELSATGAREDYVEVVDAHTLRAIPRVMAGTPARLILAAFVGTTRLIDNAPLER